MSIGYEDIHTNVSESITIMGIPFYAENIQAEEPFNRREREFTPILGGTERVNQGKYIHREYTFITTWFFPTGKPNSHDDILKKIMSKPVEVISPYMGGKFNALVTIRKTYPENSPNHVELDVTVTEVPSKKSLIPGESFTIPSTTKIKTKVKTNNTNKSSSVLKTLDKEVKKSIKSKRNKSTKKNKTRK